jgi:hypothetical protein
MSLAVSFLSLQAAVIATATSAIVSISCLVFISDLAGGLDIEVPA